MCAAVSPFSDSFYSSSIFHGRVVIFRHFKLLLKLSMLLFASDQIQAYLTVERINVCVCVCVCVQGQVFNYPLLLYPPLCFFWLLGERKENFSKTGKSSWTGTKALYHCYPLSFCAVAAHSSQSPALGTMQKEADVGFHISVHPQNLSARTSHLADHSQLSSSSDVSIRTSIA